MTIRRQGSSSAGKGRGKKGGRKPRGKSGSYGKVPPKGSQRISLEGAIELTQRYRKAAPASEHGGFFWAEGIQEILSQPGCVGIRYYHGLGAEGTYQIVLVGVDADGNDITKLARPKGASRGARAALAAGAGEAVLLDHHWPCPPYCPPGTSPLL